MNYLLDLNNLKHQNQGDQNNPVCDIKDCNNNSRFSFQSGYGNRSLYNVCEYHLVKLLQIAVNNNYRSDCEFDFSKKGKAA